MKLIPLVCFISMLVYTQADDDEHVKAFSKAITTISDACKEKHTPTEEDKKALRKFSKPETPEGNAPPWIQFMGGCFLQCCFDGLGIMKGATYDPETFENQAKENLKDNEDFKKLKTMLDNCKSTVPKGTDKCAVAAQVMDCFHSHEEQTSCLKDFFSKVFPE